MNNPDGTIEQLIAEMESLRTCVAELEQAEREQRMLAKALRDTVAAVNSTFDLDEVLDCILANVRLVVPHDIANVHLIEADEVRIARARGYNQDHLGAPQMGKRYRLADAPLFHRMVQTGLPVVISNTQTDPDWVSFPGTPWIRSYVGVPIRLDGKVIGFLNLDSATPNSFSSTHAGRLQAFADQIAIAVQNAHLLSDLEARNRELDAFSYTVAHDLRAPLSLILGHAEVAAAFIDNVSSQARKSLEAIQEAALKMTDIIEQLLKLATLRDADEVIERVEVAPLVEAVLARFERHITARGIAVEVLPDLPPALGYGPWIEEVFANLLDNAIKYIGKDNPDPRIVIRGERREECVYYQVQDNGIGIAAQHRESVFEMFKRLRPDKVEGLGLGLSIVHRIVTRLNGEIGLKSLPGQGSTFWFTLPAAR
jgi:signal transduction histidine kinase